MGLFQNLRITKRRSVLVRILESRTIPRQNRLNFDRKLEAWVVFCSKNYLHGNRPSSIDIALNDPVWHHTHALMNQFKAGFALTYRSDWESPNAAWAVERQLNADAKH